LELCRVVTVTEVIEAGLFIILTALEDVGIADGGGLDFLSVRVVNLEFPKGCDMVIFDCGSIGIQVPSPNALANIQDFDASLQIYPCPKIHILVRFLGEGLGLAPRA
jgi:hypothetical protein